METDAVWTDLVEWLARIPGGTGVEDKVRLVHTEAGRGLVARGSHPPGTVLISIPNAALLNLRTLRPLYPPVFASLNASQWLSLHIALQFRRHLSAATLPTTERSSARENGASAPRDRPPPQQPSSRKRPPIPQDKYWPYLASLPRSFPTIPLAWAIHALSAETLRADFAVPDGDASLVRLREAEAVPGMREARRRRREGHRDLLERMPGAARRNAEDVERRFREDWIAVKQVWAEHGKLVEGELTFLDFVLAWLNVNTRSIYFDIDGRKENNLTLCPVIDMINHSPGRVTKPDPRLSCLTFPAPSAKSSDPRLGDGDELSFQYGSHDDAFLLAEYGFVVGDDNLYNAVVVDEYVEALFEAQGAEGELKKGILKDEGYWGDMTLQATPPASPSWRVLVALRLLHHRLPAGTSASLSASALAPWYHVLSGARETVSPANEAKVVASWRAIAHSAVLDSEAGVKKCEELVRQWDRESGLAEGRGEKEKDKSQLEDWRNMRASLQMIRTVWASQGTIARAVLKVDEAAS